MHRDSVDSFFEEAYVALPVFVHKRHKQRSRRKHSQNTRKAQSDPAAGLPADHPLAKNQVACMRNAAYGLPSKKRSRRKVYVEEAEQAIDTWYRDNAVDEELNAKVHLEQAQQEGKSSNVHPHQEHAMGQPVQVFARSQSLDDKQAPAYTSVEQYQQAWLSQRRSGAQFEISRLIDARERQVVALLQMVDHAQDVLTSQEEFFGALLAVRRKSIEVVEGYATLVSQNLSSGSGSDHRQAALRKASDYMARQMAHDLTRVSVIEPFASWLGMQLRLNPFISTHTINGNLAVVANKETQLDEQDLQRGAETQCCHVKSAVLTVPQELLMQPAEFRRCCGYGDLIWQAYRSERENWVLDQAQQTGAEDATTTADDNNDGQETYDMAQVLELCNNIREQTVYIKQRVQETNHLYEMCQVAEIFSAWRGYTQQQLLNTRRRMDCERVVVCSTLYAWSNYTSKMKRLRLLQGRVRDRLLSQIVEAWRGAIEDLKKPKLLRRRILLRIARTCMTEWKTYTSSSTAVRAFHRKRRQRVLAPYFHAIQSFAILQQYSLYRRLERRTKLTFVDSFLLQSCIEYWKAQLVFAAAFAQLERIRKKHILHGARQHWFKRTHNFVERVFRSVRRWSSRTFRRRP